MIPCGPPGGCQQSSASPGTWGGQPSFARFGLASIPAWTGAISSCIRLRRRARRPNTSASGDVSRSCAIQTVRCDGSQGSPDAAGWAGSQAKRSEGKRLTKCTSAYNSVYTNAILVSWRRQRNLLFPFTIKSQRCSVIVYIYPRCLANASLLSLAPPKMHTFEGRMFFAVRLRRIEQGRGRITMGRVGLTMSLRAATEEETSELRAARNGSN